MKQHILSILWFICDLIVPPRPTEQAVRGLVPADLHGILRVENGALPYADPRVRALVWEVKYYANPKAATLCGEILAEVLMEVAGESIGKPLLLPIPIHKTRRKERGHNQTEVLVEAALRTLESVNKISRRKVWKPTAPLWALRRPEDFLERNFIHAFEYSPHMLVRTKHTQQQQGLPKQKRLSNVAHSMEVMHPEKIIGRVCIVVDDVSTTGATFMEAERALKRAGAAEVICVALAQS